MYTETEFPFLDSKDADFLPLLPPSASLPPPSYSLCCALILPSAAEEIHAAVFFSLVALWQQQLWGSSPWCFSLFSLSLLLHKDMQFVLATKLTKTIPMWGKLTNTILIWLILEKICSQGYKVVFLTELNSMQMNNSKGNQTTPFV